MALANPCSVSDPPPPRSFFDSIRKIGRKSSSRAQSSPCSQSSDLRGYSRPDRPCCCMNTCIVLSNEPTPAYTPSPTPTLTSGSKISEPHGGESAEVTQRSALPTREDPYSFLTTFDTVLLIDDSGSMAGRSWREVSKALSTPAQIITRHDSDGIDTYFLNHKSLNHGTPADGVVAPGGYRGIKRAAAINEIFERIRPNGGTPTGMRVHNILRPYLARCEKELGKGREVRPLNLIVLNDEIPSNEVESVLFSAAEKLDKLEAPPYQVEVQFFRVGGKESGSEIFDGLPNISPPSPDIIYRITSGLSQTLFNPLLLLPSLIGCVGATSPYTSHKGGQPHAEPSLQDLGPAVWYSLGLIACYRLIQWRVKSFDNIKTAIEFRGGISFLSSIATLLGGCSERLPDIPFILTIVFALSQIYNYAQPRLSAFKLGRIYTAAISLAGCMLSYTIATTAALFLQPVGRYKNNTSLMVGILPLVVFAISYSTCALLEDTDFGRDMDAGKYGFAIRRFVAMRTGLDLNMRDVEAGQPPRVGPHHPREGLNRGRATGHEITSNHV